MGGVAVETSSGLSVKGFEVQGLEQGAWRHVDDEARERQGPDPLSGTS